MKRREHIHYRDGYKYVLDLTYTVQTSVCPEYSIVTTFLDLFADGVLTIKAGYAWDGPSGPVLDIKEFMRASLVHDALYQLMREGHIPVSCKAHADEEMKRICLEDGMAYPLAEIAFQGVDHFGYSSCQRQEKKVLTAPK